MAKVTQTINGDSGLTARTNFNEAMKTVSIDSDDLLGDGTIGSPLALNADLKKSLTTLSSTSLTEGGDLSINGGDSTKFDLTAGTGVHVDSFTDPENPVFTPVSWAQQLAITVTNLATQDLTYLSIDSTGALLQTASLPYGEDTRDVIVIGVITHSSRTQIDDIGAFTQVPNTNLGSSIHDMNTALGLVNFAGNKYTANGSNLKLDRSAGSIWSFGFNFKNDKKNPSFIDSSLSTQEIFLYSWRDGSGGFNLSPAFATDIVPGLYDDGTGGASAPSGVVQDHQYTIQRVYWVADSGFSVIQAGQNTYPNIEAARAAVDSEEFDLNFLFQGTSHRSTFIVKGNATDLSDNKQAIFQEEGRFSSTKKAIGVTDGVSNMYNFANGVVIEHITTEVSSDGTDITFSLSREDGGDLTVQFDSDNYILEASPSNDILLTAGTDIVPVLNYIYVELVAEVATLTSNTTGFPATIHAPLGTVLVGSAAFTQTEGAYKHHEWDNALGNGAGGWDTVTSWIRDQNATYKSGVAPSFSGGGTATVVMASTSGVVRQLTDHAFPAFTDPADIYCINDPDTPYRKITNFLDLQKDSTGASLLGDAYGIVVWGVVSEDTGDCKLYCNLPSGTEGDFNRAREDKKKYINYGIPEEFKGTGFLIYRLLCDHKTTTLDIDFGGAGDDLRGQFPNTVAGSSTAVGTEFPDSTFRVQNATDTTKEVALDASAITTATTRTLTVQDKDYTIAGLDDLDLKADISGQVFTGAISATNLSNTNSGDQTSIIGITGTKEEFDTALTNDDFAYIGTDNNFTSNQTFGQAVTITGDLTVNGTTTTINTETVLVEDNILTVNAGETGAGVTAGSAGIEVDRGTETNYEFKFVESDDSFKIGETGALQSVATREDTPTNTAIPYFDTATSQFKTDSNIYSDGTNVGIGTTTPNDLLSVVAPGAAQFNGFTAQINGNTELGLLVTSKASDLQRWYGGASGDTERMRITNAGNVGIGTTTPDAKLHIVDTVGANTAKDIIIGSTIDSFPNDVAKIQVQRDGSLGQGWNFITTDETGATSEAMRIATTGNVGIGETAPHAKLDVVKYGPTAGTDGGIALGYNTWQIRDGGPTDGDYSLRIDRRVSANWYTAFAIDRNSGNVGIGTDTPVTSLDVRGEISINYAATHGLRFYNEDRNNWSSIGNNIATGSGAANLVLRDSTGEVARITGGNVGIGTADQFGSGAKVVGIANATTVPTTNPTGGGVLYVEGGALKFRGSSGTITTVAVA